MRIRELINDGTLPPGSRVPEKQLCDQFGISRTPLREALKMLAAEGMIELLPNRGARVVRLTTRLLEDTFYVMGALEGISGELACQRMTTAELAEIKVLHYQMVAHHARGELEPYFELNRRIHEALISAAHNDTLAELYRNLSERVRRTRYTARMSDEQWAQAVDDHEAMIAALDARDAPRIGEILREHVQHKLAMVAGSDLVVEEDAASPSVMDDKTGQE